MEQPAKSTATASRKPFGSRHKLLLLLIFVAFCYWTVRTAQRNRQLQKADAETGYQAPTQVEQSHESGEGSLHPLDPVLKLAEQIKLRIESDVVDYTATITKRERIRGKLNDEETMEAKIRQSRPNASTPIPFAVYLKFIQPSSSAGREVIWVDGQNDGDLLSYQFRIPVKIAPTGTIAMMGNKYSITEIGIQRMVEKLIEKGQRDRELGDCRVEIFEHQEVDGRDCKLIQVTHPDHDKRFDFHIAQIYIDSQLNLPIRYAAYLWPDQPSSAPPLEEEYTYKNLKINVGLSDKDFDPKNPDYRFP